MEPSRIKLSALWAARMLSGLQGDSTRLHDPEALKEPIAGTTAVPVTGQLLLLMSLIFAVPILMSVLSLTLSETANRRANRSAGTFFVLFDVAFLILLSWPFSYETVWAVMYVVCTAMITWYAWKWPENERPIAPSRPSGID